MRLVLKLIFLLSPTISFSSDKLCQEWFSESKIEPGKNCVLQCSSLLTDMSTFQCPNQCDELCNNKKCPVKPHIKKLFKSKMFFKEDNKTIATKEMSSTEIKLLERSLLRIPDIFFDKNFRGFVKLSKNPDPLQPSASSTYIDGYIILYKTTFFKPQRLERKVLHELAHHFHENHGKKLFSDYKKNLKWEKPNSPRTGPFLKPDAKYSPEEDFATNLEYYLAEPKTLNAKVPNAHKWFKSKLKPQYKLKDCKP